MPISVEEFEQKPENELSSRSTNSDKPRCPNCKAAAVRTRITDNKHVCNTCGERWARIAKESEKAPSYVRGTRDALEHTVRAFLNSDNKNGFIVYGRTGIGKSHTIRKAVGNSFELISGYKRPQDLAKLMRRDAKMVGKRRSLKKNYLLDDVSGLFSSNNSGIDLIKQLTVPGKGPKRISSGRKDLWFEGKVIFIWNKILQKNDPNVKAILDRCWVFHLNLTRDELINSFKLERVPEDIKSNRISLQDAEEIIEALGCFQFPTHRDYESAVEIWRAYPNKSEKMKALARCIYESRGDLPDAQEKFESLLAR